MSCKNEHEKINMTVCTGAGANTDITLTGITAADTVKAVVNLTDLAQVALAGLVISADKFKITASTASKTLLVLWYDSSAG